MINIAGINKALVLQALYNNSKVQGLGFYHTTGKAMTLQEADAEIRQALERSRGRMCWDYLHGKVMKIDITTDCLHPGLYDRDNGAGAALRALQNAGLEVSECM